MDRIRLRDVNWIGDGALDRVIGDGIEMFVRVRSTRAPQPAWLRAVDGGYEVELVAGEEGVSPGQACVFYDAPIGAGARARRRIHQERDGDSRGDAGRAASTSRRSPRRCAAKEEDQGRGHGCGHRPRGGRKGLRALGAGLRSGVRQGVRRGPPLDHRGSRQDRRPRSRRRRRHRAVAVGLFAQHEIMRRRYFRADAAPGAEARARVRPDQCRNARGDGRQEPGVSRCVFRCGGGAIRHHRGAGSGSARWTISSAC